MHVVLLNKIYSHTKCLIYMANHMILFIYHKTYLGFTGI